MDKKQQVNRRSATHQFISSLDELRVVLESDDSGDGDSPQPECGPGLPILPEPRLTGEKDLEALLDDAVQDIEQFMADHSQADP